MNDIERADKIVNLNWTPACTFSPLTKADIRRCRYLDWIAKQPAADVDPRLPSVTTDTYPRLGIAALSLEVLAAVIRAIDDARRPKGDGLPPGPWRFDDSDLEAYHVRDSKGDRVVTIPREIWAIAPERNAIKAIAAYIARCGSQPVRDILAACDDEELARWAKIIAAYKVINDDVVCTMEGNGMCSWSAITFSARPR